MNDCISDPTSTCRLGVTVTPRWPASTSKASSTRCRALAPGRHRAHGVSRGALGDGAGGGGLLHRGRSPPAAPHRRRGPARRGRCLPRQEAAHASMHAAFNRLLMRWGVPVESVADSVLRWLAVVDWTSSDLRSAVAMAGEHFLGEIGNAILSRPELLEGVDPRIARLFRWHGYEEVEHKACSSTRSTRHAPRAVHVRRPHRGAVDRRRSPRPRAPIGLIPHPRQRRRRRRTSTRARPHPLRLWARRDAAGSMARRSLPTIGSTSTRGVPRQPALPGGAPRHDRRSRMGGSERAELPRSSGRLGAGSLDNSSRRK